MRGLWLCGLSAVGILCGGQALSAPAVEATVDYSYDHPTLIDGDCDFEISGVPRIDCAVFFPEGTAERDGRPPISLPVVVLRRHEDDGLRYPLLYLEGGPGYAAGVDGDSVRRWWYWLRSTGWRNDLVLFDPRGTGQATPHYRCPEYDDQILSIVAEPLSARADARLYADAMQRCYQRLRGEDARLEAFTTRATADDAAAIMSLLPVAEGHGGWSVFAVSYGTRVALSLLRDFPEAVDRVILDSVYPNDVDEILHAPELFDAALNRVFEGCAQDVLCAVAYPDLESITFDLVERLNGDPIMLQGTSTHVAGPVDVGITGDRLLMMVFFALYRQDRIVSLPAILAAAGEGKYDRLRPLVDDILAWLLDPEFSDVVMHSVHCHDRRPTIGRQDFEDSIAPFPHLATLFDASWDHDLCRFWRVQSAPDEVRTAVTSAVPTLLLAGAYDPVTPAIWARRVAARFSNAHLYEFPALGHGAVFSEPCAALLADRFLRDELEQGPPDCLASLQAPQFVTARPVSGTAAATWLGE